ncbi:calmodulin [Rhodopirellula sallentina]|uniref:Calmodulin n=1 Tax=Rhodopirellula sallentina SM41 TaxID=1263870 RepID=M5UE43_9BACT|nr:calmodulin [Rhodopirellula sallentina]EMI56131.1 calmodulin [Rhodopirellula sallentina SM41]
MTVGANLFFTQSSLQSILHRAASRAFMTVALLVTCGAPPPILAGEASVPMARTATTGDDTSMISTGVYNSAIAEANRRLLDYDADANGQWSQPTTRNVDNHSVVPLELRTPRGVIQISLSVFIDGNTPQQHVEKLLSETIDRADGHSNEKTITSNETSQSENPTQTQDEDATSAVRPKAYVRDSVLTKLERFVSATGTVDVDKDELRWMLDQWRPGPVWLIARDAVSPPRPAFEPLLTWLDRDRDGNLSSDEIASLPEQLKRLDNDRNRIVSTAELQSAVARDRRPPIHSAARTQWNLRWAKPTSESSANTTLATLIATANVRSSGTTPPADEPEQTSRLTVQSDTTDVFGNGNHVSVTIADSHGPMRVHFTAYESPELSPVARCQFSIAAFLGDQPLWNHLDQNADGRLVELEQRAAVDRLMQLDRNDDRSITPDEWPVSFHVVISQGNSATVNLDTSTPRSPTSPTAPDVQTPDWFVGMDTNRDGSLSQDEFLGSPNRFGEYDVNKDGLITPAELTTDDQ